MIVTITTINLDLYKKDKFKLIVSTIRYNQTHERMNYKIVIHSINSVSEPLLQSFGYCTWVKTNTKHHK